MNAKGRCAGIILAIVGMAVEIQAQNFTHRSYFETPTWFVEVSNMETSRLTCSVDWEAVATGIPPKGGQKRRGTFTIIVPAYPGFGSATKGRRGIRDVGDFTYQIICNVDQPTKK